MMNTTFYFGEENFPDLISDPRYTQIVLLADAKTNGFCVTVMKKMHPLLENSSLIVIPDGEQSKSIESCQLIWNELLQLNADKQTLLINVGGGMICDIGGFAASVYKRGIDFVNIPTTLLAMADAAHGGKTAVNLQGIKNVIGVFHYPIAVYIEPVLLLTLPDRNLRSGIAEVLKHALLQSEEIFNEVLQYDEAKFYTMDVIKKSILFKKKIVAQDEFDANIRQTLNIGHSMGHAIESYSMQTATPLLHGEAVMLGLIYEGMLAHLLFDFPSRFIEEMIRFKHRIFPVLSFSFSYTDIEKYLLSDKKNTKDIRMSLPVRPGECKWQVKVHEAQVKEAIERVGQLI